MHTEIKDGSKFGFWIVIKKSNDRHSYKGSIRYYDCLCVCGAVKAVRSESLVESLSLSCGCKRSKTLKDVKVGMQFGTWGINDSYFDSEIGETIYECKCDNCEKQIRAAHSALSNTLNKACNCNNGRRAFFKGARFGNWTILGPGLKVGTRVSDIYYTCECDCGTIREVVSASLKRILSTSCGCTRSKAQKKISVLVPMPLKYSPNEVHGGWRILARDEEYYCLCECINCGFLYRITPKNGGKTISNRPCVFCTQETPVTKEQIFSHIRSRYELSSLDSIYFTNLDFRSYPTIRYTFSIETTVRRGTIFCVEVVNGMPISKQKVMFIPLELDNIIQELRVKNDDQEIFLNKDILHPLLSLYSQWDVARLLLEGYIVNENTLTVNV